MINEEKDSYSNAPVSTTKVEEKAVETNDSLEDSIIRNDTIPETSKDTPGSNGVFPVGAFDTSKD
jgi:hypothetical protein